MTIVFNTDELPNGLGKGLVHGLVTLCYVRLSIWCVARTRQSPNGCIKARAPRSKRTRAYRRRLSDPCTSAQEKCCTNRTFSRRLSSPRKEKRPAAPSATHPKPNEKARARGGLVGRGLIGSEGSIRSFSTKDECCTIRTYRLGPGSRTETQKACRTFRHGSFQSFTRHEGWSGGCARIVRTYARRPHRV